jgi:hypothetical protein
MVEYNTLMDAHQSLLKAYKQLKAKHEQMWIIDRLRIE